MEKLRLPRTITHETIRVIGRVYGNIGSIRNCKTIEDFGRYRFILVKEYDKEIRKIKAKRDDKDG